MAKFKIGDTVVCRSSIKTKTRNVKKGMCYIISGFHNSGMIYLEGKEKYYSSARFVLANKKRKKKQEKKMISTESWKFIISEENALCHNEIASTLDYNKLIAITTTKDPKVCPSVYVHRRIIHKAIYLEITTPDFPETMLPCGHFVYTLNDAAKIKEITQWVRKVHHANWKKSKSIEVLVRYPKL